MPRYKVTITYTEPSYSQVRGIDELVYRGAFTVTASDPAVAIRLAREQFDEAQRISSVSWQREIKSATWSLLDRGPELQPAGRP